MADPTAEAPAQALEEWWQLSAPASSLSEGERLHTSIEGRFVTIFRHKGSLSAIDSICHHAGGPLTAGPLQEIEDLGVSVVLCPWHRFAVDIRLGLKVYQSVEIQNGAPVPTGWRIGKMVQRSHTVIERTEEDSLFVKLVVDASEPCSSDKDASSARCAQSLDIVGVSGPHAL